MVTTLSQVNPVLHDMIYDMIYLTAIGLPHSGNSKVHIYTKKKYIEQHNRHDQYIEQHFN